MSETGIPTPNIKDNLGKAAATADSMPAMMPAFASGGMGGTVEGATVATGVPGGDLASPAPFCLSHSFRTGKLGIILSTSFLNASVRSR